MISFEIDFNMNRLTLLKLLNTDPPMTIWVTPNQTNQMTMEKAILIIWTTPKLEAITAGVAIKAISNDHIIKWCSRDFQFCRIYFSERRSKHDPGRSLESHRNRCSSNICTISGRALDDAGQRNIFGRIGRKICDFANQLAPDVFHSRASAACSRHTRPKCI
ncbi:hypothetical protein CO615_05965 [Lysobacteraceae bacterium NML75-0749]|nr:hypothetical protein CO615_05965 [Xanthomonadaceae bacterium NML75-0749]